MAIRQGGDYEGETLAKGGFMKGIKIANADRKKNEQKANGNTKDETCPFCKDSLLNAEAVEPLSGVNSTMFS